VIALQQEIVYMEERDDGAVGIIGGELWEASLLLCAYASVEGSAALEGTVLELGSGVGVAGLYIACLQLKNPLGHVIMTDYDDRVLHNLRHAIELTFGDAAGTTDANDVYTGIGHGGHRVSVRQLDWQIFCDCTEAANYMAHEPWLRDVTAIVGSDLVYGQHHVYLADTIEVRK
jgi:hypothetical protein